MSIQKNFNKNASLLSCSAEEVVERILDNIKEADSWYKKMGPLGVEFARAANALEFKQHIDTSINHGAHYEYYSYPKGFMNKIKYGAGAVTDPASIFYTKTHEIIHALQAHKAIAFHVTPFNPNSNYIICPKDMVKLDELAEHDAYAKHMWFCNELNEKEHELEKSLNGSPIQLTDFKNAYDENNSYDNNTGLSRTLQQAGYFAMNYIMRTKNGQTKSLKEIYHSQSLDSYYNACKARQTSEPDKHPTIIRLEKHDLAEIGNSFGPNFLSDENGKLLDSYNHFPNFDTDINQHKYLMLNQAMGIKDEMELPSLTEVLQKDGISRKDFMEGSMGKPLPI
jgi:hypothetical protein